MLRLRFLVDNFTNFVYLCARIIRISPDFLWVSGIHLSGEVPKHRSFNNEKHLELPCGSGPFSFDICGSFLSFRGKRTRQSSSKTRFCFSNGQPCAYGIGQKCQNRNSYGQHHTRITPCAECQ